MLLPVISPEDQTLVSLIEQRIEEAVGESSTALKAEQEVKTPAASAELAPVQEPSTAGLGTGKAEDTAAPATQHPERAHRPRHKDKETSAPGQYVELDLHEMSVRDALSQVRGEMQHAIDDPLIRCLVVVHGYGKNQGSAAIRGEVRACLRREFGKHDRVRKILRGELLDGLDEESQAVKEACPEISFGKLGRNNSGITLVLLN